MKVYGIEEFDKYRDFQGWEPICEGDVYLNLNDAILEAQGLNEEAIASKNHDKEREYNRRCNEVNKHNALVDAGFEETYISIPEKPEQITKLGKWDTRYRVYEINVIEGGVS